VVFATSDAASATIIQNSFVKAITALQKKCAIVTNVVWDRHQKNKGVRKFFAVSGKIDDVTHYIRHPTEPDEKIFFLFHVPHIIKFIRNHIFKQKYVQVGIYN
jgi:hypothetical protein